MGKVMSFLGFTAAVVAAVALSAFVVRSFVPGLGRFMSYTGA